MSTAELEILKPGTYVNWMKVRCVFIKYYDSDNVLIAIPGEFCNEYEKVASEEITPLH